MLSDIEEGTVWPTPVDVEENMSLLDVLIILASRRATIFTIEFVLVLATVILSLIMTPEYTATTSMTLPQNNSSGASILSQLGSLGSVASMAGSSFGLKNPNDLQVALLKSRTVEDAVVERFHLIDRFHLKRKSDARRRLEQVVKIDNGAKDGLIRLTVRDQDAKVAADIANGYVEEFKKFSATLAVTEASQRRKFFEKQLSDAKDNLANAEEQLKKTQQTTGLLQLDAQSRAVIESVAQLRAQIAAKEVQIRGMRSFATTDNPQLQVAEEELSGLQAEQKKLGASSDDSANALLIPKGVMQQSGLEYVRRLRDVKYYETIFELIARQYEVAKVDEARQGAVVQTVDAAVVPDGRSSPKRTLMVIGAAFLGIFVSIGWVLMSEWLRRLSQIPSERVRLQRLRGQLRMRRRAL